MSFVSFAFLLLLSVVVVLRLTIGRTRTRPGFLCALLLTSLLFYSWHIPVYVFILVSSGLVDFLLGKAIAARPQSSRHRRLLVSLSVVTNLTVLGFFKYFNFAIELVTGLLGTKAGAIAPELDVALPVGISFYTFQSMSYTIDIYRGALRPEKSFTSFLLYISFFPQLVAGPIVRAKEFLYQLTRKRRPNSKVWSEGAFLIIQGYFLKMVVADNLGPVVDLYWPAIGRPGANSLFTLNIVFLFSCQIFCDFAGYTQIARGIAYLLGFRLPINFRNPYIAASFKEFWTRWHITLSSWLRDYLYISLGGNRISKWRTGSNLLVVMLLGGLWHGAALTFLAWGTIHGFALVLERTLGLHQTSTDKPMILRISWYCFVQWVVLISWIFFRSGNISQAVAILGNLCAFRLSIPDNPEPIITLVFTVPVILMHLRAFARQQSLLPSFGPTDKALWSGVMLYLIAACYGTSHAFIYFQF